MQLSEPVQAVRRLGSAPRSDTVAMAERAIDTYLDGYRRLDDRAVALDILLRDFARLRVREPALDGIIGEIERHIDGLFRALARRAA